MTTRRLLLTTLALLALFAAAPAVPTAAAETEWPDFRLCSTAQPDWYYTCDGLLCLHAWAYAWNVDERVCTPA